MGDKANLFGIINAMLLKNGKQRALFSLVLATITLTAIGAALFPIFFSLGIDALTKGDVQVDLGVKYIIAFGIGLTIVGILEQAQWLTFGPMNLRLQRHLTTHVFRHALSLPYYRLKNYTTYEIGRTVERGLDAVREITSNLTFFLIPTLIELVIAASVIAFMIDVWIALFLFSALFLYGVITNISAAKIRKATEGAMETGIQAWNFGLDGVANAELVQQSNMVPDFTERLNAKLKINDRAWAVTFKQRAYFGALQALVFGVVVLGVLWRGAVDTGQGTMSIGELVLLNTYIIRLLQPVETFARVYREVNSSLGEARLLTDLLSVPVPQIAQLDAASSDPVSLETRNLTLKIDDRTLLADLSFAVPSHGQLFIVGPSGVGKSSLLKVISCLSVASGGDYLINGQKITEQNATNFRSNIAVVQQDCLLFDWSISENIAFGIEAPAEEIENVIRKLALDEVVQRHQTLGEPTVGERGNRLSGGEKQRLSMARALLTKPRLLILDEPTAALDEGNRKRVLDALAELQQTCTSIFVTHDLSLLNDDTPVLFLAPAQRYWAGAHSVLLANNSEYRKFVEGEAGAREAALDEDAIRAEV
ncbi:ABC transporter ATP-binding protein [Pararhizobium sp. LjRoot235]|uniref:ATP-binding cassette domain-containing protein n=1 Tax=Pararhizobium sp. LjRoot235 TaxID=3342291 RepID=UPI003ED07978